MNHFNANVCHNEFIQCESFGFLNIALYTVFRTGLLNFAFLYVVLIFKLTYSILLFEYRFLFFELTHSILFFGHCLNS